MSELDATPPTNHESRPIVCRNCGLKIAAPDRFCRYCGRPVAAAAAVISAEAIPAPSDRVGQRYSWYENVWFVLAMLFLVLGPLALPLLWRSRQFSLLWKLVLTLLIGLLTAAMAIYVYQRLNAALAPLLKELSP